uniref:Transposable element Tc1 transposase n=1 Tax=Bactrocera dorsalis TaxID=27457 RepID=A0A034UZ64_BACDO
MGRRTSLEQRELVIHHFKLGKSQRSIAEMVNIPSSTVQHIIERFLNENRMHNKGRNAPNKIFTQSDERWIIRKIRENPKLSAQKLADEVKNFFGKDCSASTIRRILRSHDFHGPVALKKPFINQKNRVNRLTFAKNHVLKDATFWDTVIFSDESKFNVFGSDGRSMVWRKPNKQLDVKNLRATVKHGGGSVMVWACMAATGVGNLVFIDGNMDKNM